MFNCDELTLVLVVAGLAPTLLSEIKRMGWTLEPLEGGYARIHEVMYPSHVAVIDDVCQEERSEILRALSPEYIQTLPPSVQRKVQKLLNKKVPRARRASAGAASKEPENVGAPTTRRSCKKAA